MAEQQTNDVALSAAFRLTDATQLFLSAEEAAAFFQRAYRIVKEAIRAARAIPEVRP